MTYFMMGGRYDPVSNGFSSNSFAFHMMMIFFFFFTVILMLNVLIALINNAINDGDQAWQLDWLQNRMRYIESAENMTYDIPDKEKDVSQAVAMEAEATAAAMTRLVEVELRKQLDTERASSERQIGELRQQLRDQQEILGQILGKLNR
ncbi:hypothetical protein BGX29_003272 [Mortierella sp. GBA35]|nr:hypothetical protein BGX29_003272 [Mortierella sp. GBA35]